MQSHRIPSRPEHTCWACGSDNWWLRVAYGHPEWICGKCHPAPKLPDDQLKKLQESPLGRQPGEKPKGRYLAFGELPTPVDQVKT